MHAVWQRALLAGATTVIAAVLLAPASLAGQVSRSANPVTKWSVQRTAWGDPDLQGIWSTFDPTPLQTPNPDPVAAAAEAKVQADHDGKVFGDSAVPYWRDRGNPVSLKRPSLVVDPPNGRIPLRPGLVTLRNYRREEDSWKFHNPYDRCITRGKPGLLPVLGAHRILQTPGYVVIQSEVIHDVRLIPVDGRPHVGSTLRLWNGDSRGRWEGTTLVIDTTNYNDRNTVITDNIQDIPQSDALHVVEHLTPVDANTIAYEITIEDPRVFTQTWKAALPLNRDPKYGIYEYACHEGNVRYMEGVLRAGRVREKETDAASEKASGR